MSDQFATPQSLDPEAGFTPNNPSVSQAAKDLRHAAGEFRDAATDKAREFAHQTADQAKEAKSKALESAQQFRDAAVEKAQALKSVAADKAAQFRNVADEQWRDTRDKAKELHVTAEDYVRQHPTKCVLGALGVGFLIGLISRR